jgi:hypothetical protein
LRIGSPFIAFFSMATPKRSHKRTPSHLDETASPSTLPEPVVASATPNRSHKRKTGTPSHLDETSMLPEPVVVASGKKPSSGEKPSVAKYVETKQHKFCVASFCSHTKLTNPALFVLPVRNLRAHLVYLRRDEAFIKTHCSNLAYQMPTLLYSCPQHFSSVSVGSMGDKIPAYYNAEDRFKNDPTFQSPYLRQDVVATWDAWQALSDPRSLSRSERNMARGVVVNESRLVQLYDGFTREALFNECEDLSVKRAESNKQVNSLKMQLASKETFIKQLVLQRKELTALLAASQAHKPAQPVLSWEWVRKNCDDAWLKKNTGVSSFAIMEAHFKILLFYMNKEDPPFGITGKYSLMNVFLASCMKLRMRLKNHFIETIFGFGTRVFAKKYRLCRSYCNCVYDHSLGLFKSKLDIDDERDPLYTKDDLLWSAYKILDG